MFKWLGSLVDSNEKEIKRILPLVDKINDLEAEFQPLNDIELAAKTEEFKARIKDGETLDEILPEAFAAVREAARRTIKQRHYDVQLIGGIVLHQGRIAEMKTGEGKTLVATLPLYLNCLTGEGCHLATVNDYLARRDPYWMGPVYHALGVKVASIYPMQNPDDYTPARLYDPSQDSGDERWRHFKPVTRKLAYEADITYGTSSEFGFDYLRDNMVLDLSQCVQRPLNYSIVDEVDNLLIDEARTPLIISGPAEEIGPLYKAVDSVVSRMRGKTLAHEPFTQEEKEEAAQLEDQYDYLAYQKEHYVKETIRAQEKLASAFGMNADSLFGGEHEDTEELTREEAKKRVDIISIFHHAMTAHALYRRDRDYVVKEGEVIIVDEFTGRLMLGRRYSEGLHQAIEAKEHVKIQRESRTYATVTIQNYFRMYKKLGGMTGTAATEAEEFHKIYKLDVVAIPANKEMIRKDFSDRIYKNEEGKFRAVVGEIDEFSKQGRPVLVGTVSIEKSERLSEMLMKKGIAHRVLNAKEHTKEAEIIAEAGKPGAVTVATNMAGRGVDIILGGKKPEEPEKPSAGEGENLAEWEKAGKEWQKAYADWEKRHEGVVKAGGLHVLGTERHEARRIDNQLRGRAGRQGDPGSSRFYVSLEDDIVRRFGGDRIKGFMDKVGLDEETSIENVLVNKTIENTQVKVEGHHFDMRKHLVDYDDVVNAQREAIYDFRREILSGTNQKEKIVSWVKERTQSIVTAYRIFAEEIPNLRQDIHYTLDANQGRVHLTDEGKMTMTDKLAKEGLLISPALDMPPDIEDYLNFWLSRFLRSALKSQVINNKERDVDGLIGEVKSLFPTELDGKTIETLGYSELEDKLNEQAERAYEQKEKELGAEQIRMLERLVMLRIIDSLWVEHLTEMESMRHGIGLEAMAQRDPKVVYKSRGLGRFQYLNNVIHYDIAHTIFKVSIKKEEPPPKKEQSVMANVARGSNTQKVPAKAGGHKIGRNDPCPCGSGKKYKRCCGS